MKHKDGPETAAHIPETHEYQLFASEQQRPGMCSNVPQGSKPEYKVPISVAFCKPKHVAEALSRLHYGNSRTSGIALQYYNFHKGLVSRNCHQLPRLHKSKHLVRRK